MAKAICTFSVSALAIIVSQSRGFSAIPDLHGGGDPSPGKSQQNRNIKRLLVADRPGVAVCRTVINAHLTANIEA